MKIDETNLAIIKHLKDGRKSFSSIAEDLSLTENTVRSRVNKLMDEGVLQITGLVDPQSLPGHQVIIVAAKLSTVELEKKAHELNNLRGVVSVSVVTGRYDILMYVLLNDEKGFGLLEFFTEELAKVDKIQDFETFVVYQGIDLHVPYVL